jgi:hypothetical protein
VTYLELEVAVVVLGVQVVVLVAREAAWGVSPQVAV